MKKLFMLFAIILIVSLCYADALCETDVDVFTFVEQYIKNWEYMRYNYPNDSVDMNLWIHNNLFADEVYYKSFGYHSLSCPAGTVEFDDRYMVHSVAIDFYDLTKEPTEQIQFLLKSIIATSVLEFNTVETDLMPSQYKYGLSEYPDVVSASVNMWNGGEIGTKANEALGYVLADGEQHVFYEGKNYVYSLLQMKSSESEEREYNRIILVATEK